MRIILGGVVRAVSIGISIKNRLRISGIFMLVMAVAFGLLLFFGGRMIYFEMQGRPQSSGKIDPDDFLELVAHTKEKYLEPWTRELNRKDFDIDKVLVLRNI
jgi:hypothetical protein